MSYLTQRVARITNPAQCAGLQVGDTLWQLDGLGVHRMTIGEVRIIMDRTPLGSPVLLVVQRPV